MRVKRRPRVTRRGSTMVSKASSSTRKVRARLARTPTTAMSVSLIPQPCPSRRAAHPTVNGPGPEAHSRVDRMSVGTGRLLLLPQVLPPATLAPGGHVQAEVSPAAQAGPRQPGARGPLVGQDLGGDHLREGDADVDR